ncbi:hypothetical protein D3C76_1251850 [compost metagenome]
MGIGQGEVPCQIFQGSGIKDLDEEQQAGRAGDFGHTAVRADGDDGRGDKRRGVLVMEHLDDHFVVIFRGVGFFQQRSQVAGQPGVGIDLTHLAVDHRIDGLAGRRNDKHRLVAIERKHAAADVFLVIGPFLVDADMQVPVGVAPLGIIAQVPSDTFADPLDGPLGEKQALFTGTAVLRAGDVEQHGDRQCRHDKQQEHDGRKSATGETSGWRTRGKDS